MTRPGIVRADTLDLQDQDSPSAQDHSKTNGTQLEFGDRLVGAHHAQEIRHINQERHEEENNLAHAWDNVDDGTKADAAGGAVEGTKATEGDVDQASDDDLIDRVSSSPSITDEDIDFDFVYALHTFVATVEGQANATKGDTMVLLDDSNSYWWLVRVVKDSSIGYLPAEHIETPTERLARLNKHRNVDLSAAMLGDNAERSKNPLKKAMKRRGAKTVQFAAPTYVEASDYDYSDEDDDAAAEARAAHTAAAAANGVAQQQATATTAAAVAATGPVTETELAARRGSGGSIEDGPSSPNISDRAEAAPLKSRKGTTRNADSFIKDDTIETRKFTLTPNLLRDDTARAGSTSDSGRSRGGSPNSDTTAPSDSPKTKKEKKQRTLSGLFKSSKKKEKEREKEKSKERLTRKEFVTDGEAERASLDAARQSTSTMPADPAGKGSEADRKASQKGRKLQKQQAAQAPSAQGPTGTETTAAAPIFAELEGSQVAIEAPTGLEDEIPAAKSKKEIKGGKVKKARKREVLDDFDEIPQPSDSKGGSFMHGTEVVHIPMQVGDLDSSEEEDDDAEEDELDTTGEDKEGSSTPPSILEATDSPRVQGSEEPKQNIVDAATSLRPQQQERSLTPQAPTAPPPAPPPTRAPPTPSEAVSVAPAAAASASTATPQNNPPPTTASAPAQTWHSPTTPSSTATTQAAPRTWNDAGLRAWLDGENNDVHDMLTVIYDTTGVKPASADHPLMKGYLAEERSQLDSMMAELDRMHLDFVKRRSGPAAAGPVVAAAT